MWCLMETNSEMSTVILGSNQSRVQIELKVLMINQRWAEAVRMTMMLEDSICDIGKKKKNSYWSSNVLDSCLVFPLSYCAISEQVDHNTNFAVCLED